MESVCSMYKLMSAAKSNAIDHEWFASFKYNIKQITIIFNQGHRIIYATWLDAPDAIAYSAAN